MSPGPMRSPSSLLLAAWLLAGAAACGGDDGDDDGPAETDGGGGGGDSGDGGPASADAANGACGAIGRGCEDGCASPLVCQDSAGDGFCTPDRPECGGFVGSLCPGEGQECAIYRGDTLGICLTAAERACVCAASPDALAGCPG